MRSLIVSAASAFDESKVVFRVQLCVESGTMTSAKTPTISGRPRRVGIDAAAAAAAAASGARRRR